ncbi:hypothetical protein D3C71_1806330 [compost metagenome]
MLLLLHGVLGELGCHGLGIQAAGHEEVALVAQHTDDLGSQRFVQQLQHRLPVRAVAIGDRPRFNVLARLGTDGLHVHVERTVCLLGVLGCVFHIVSSSG